MEDAPNNDDGPPKRRVVPPVHDAFASEYGGHYDGENDFDPIPTDGYDPFDSNGDNNDFPAQSAFLVEKESFHDSPNRSKKNKESFPAKEVRRQPTAKAEQPAKVSPTKNLSEIEDVVTTRSHQDNEPGSQGDPLPSSKEVLAEELEMIKEEIYQENNNVKFNINSPRQVSKAVFGVMGQSTNKDALEAVGSAGNRLADLVLKYRKLSSEIKRLNKKEELKASGTYVASVSVVNATGTGINSDSDPLLLVDASAYIFRAYFSMPPLHRRDGMPVGAVLGFCNMLNRLILSQFLKGDRPRLVLVFDAKGTTFRHELYSDYKANRPECPMDLVPQFDLIREAAKAYGVPQIEASSYEADDVIATLVSMALQQGIDTHILSGDKDLMQLVTPPDARPCVHMIDPMKMERVNYDSVMEKWGVGPELVGDVLALAGDTSDNVPGVPGIGPKIAADLLKEFGSLQQLYEQVDKVKQKRRREKLIESKDMAMLSRKLVELERAVPREVMRCNMLSEVDDQLGNLRTEPMNQKRMLTFFEKMGFRDLKRRFQDRLTQLDRAGANTPMRKKSYRRPKAVIPKPEDYQDVPF